MIRPTPYYVSQAASVPGEHGPGWFWVEWTLFTSDTIHGPFASRREAEDSIDECFEFAEIDEADRRFPLE